MYFGISQEKMEKSYSLMQKFNTLSRPKFSEQGNLRTSTSSQFLSFWITVCSYFLITKYPWPALVIAYIMASKIESKV